MLVTQALHFPGQQVGSFLSEDASALKKEASPFFPSTHEYSIEEVDRARPQQLNSAMLDLPAGGGSNRQTMASAPFPDPNRDLSSGTKGTLLGRLGASCLNCTVDAFLWTVAYRTAAQLGFLLFIPALFTEVGEESGNLSAGGNHGV